MATDSGVPGHEDAADGASLGHERWARFFAAAMVVATLANGAAPYLRRIGVIDRERYESYWRTHCGDVPVARAWGLGRRCATFEPGPLNGDRYRREKPHFFFVFQVLPPEVPIKAAKDAFMLLFVGVSLWRFRCHPRWPDLAGAWPLWGLCALVVFTAARGFARGDEMGALLGLRGMTFIAVALLGVWMTVASCLEHICRALIALLVLQLALIPGELLWGMPMAGYASVLALPSRVAGTLVQANGLGVLAAVTVAFAEFDAPDYRWRMAARISGLLVILLAGSATGWIVLFSLVALRARHRRPTWGAIVALSLAAGLLLVGLPRIVGRPNLLDSLTMGRLEPLRDLLSSGDSIFLGRGLGAGTNAEQVLASNGIRPGTGAPRSSDSTAILLLVETGVVGVLLFYAALAMAWRRQPRAAPLFLAVGLTSLTCNLPEAFPANFLLGLALAHGCARPAAATT